MKKWGPALLLFLIVLFVSASLVIGHCAEILVGFSYPSPMYPDSDIDLAFTVKNIGPKSIRVSAISVRFDWATELSYSALGTPQTIGSGIEATFPLRIHVPDGITTNIEHVVTVTVYVADPTNGAWGKDQKLETKFTFYVNKPPPRTEPFGVTQTIGILPTYTAPSPLLALTPTLVLISIPLLLAYAIVKLRARGRRPK